MNTLKPLLLTGILFSLPCLGIADTAEIEYSVKATMHTVEGTAEASPFQAVLAENEMGKETLSIEVNVPMETMVTGNKKRDKEMHHVLREDLQSVLVGTLTSTPIEAIRPGDEEAGTVQIDFAMAQKTLPVEAQISDWEEDDQQLDFTITFDLSQEAYGLKPISKMGFLKVDDAVHVITRFHIEK